MNSRVSSWTHRLAIVLIASLAATAVAGAAPPVGSAPKNFTKAPGSFYVTLPEGTKLPLSAMHVSITGTAAAERPHAVSVTLSVADADAVAFLKDAITHADLKTLVVTSPKAIVSLSNVVFGTFAQSASGTDFAIRAQKIAVAPSGSGKSFVADTNVRATAADSAPVKSSSVPLPSLSLPDIGTLHLASDTFTVARPVDSASGLGEGRASVTVEATFDGAQGFALAPAALDALHFKTATLTNGTGSFTVLGLAIGKLDATFDASGTPTVTTELAFAKLTADASGGGRSTTPASADNAKFRLTFTGKSGPTSVALVGATFGLSRKTANNGSGASSGKLQVNAAGFSVADANAMPLVVDALNGTTLRSMTLVSPAVTMAFHDVTLTKASDTSKAGGGTAQFSIAFASVDVTANGKTTIDGAAPELQSNAKPTSDPNVAVPNITFQTLGTMPLASESFSTITPQSVGSQAAGAGSGKTQSSYAFSILGAPGIPLWQAMRKAQSTGNVRVKLAAIDYLFAQTELSDLGIDFDQSGTPTVNAKLAFAKVTVVGADTKPAPATGPLTATYQDRSGVAQTFALEGASVILDRTVGGHPAGSAIFTTPDTAAAPLLDDALKNAVIKTFTIVAPTTKYTLSDVVIKNSTQSGSTATYTIAYRKIAIVSSGATWDADVASNVIGNVSGRRTAGAPKPPALSSDSFGTIALASETLSAQAATDVATGAQTGRSAVSGDLVSDASSATALFESLALPVEKAQLFASAATFDLKRLEATNLTLKLAPAGTATTSAHIAVSGLAIAAKP